MNGRGVYRDFDPNVRRSINFGYLIVPETEDRVKFIERCLRYERFSIQVEGGGGVLHNCYATKSAIRDLKFPLENEMLGSAVVFFTEPFGGKSTIVGVVNVEADGDINQNEVTVIKRKTAGNYAVVSVDGYGQVNIDVIGNQGSGKVNINVRNNTMDAEVNVSVKGNINLSTEGVINLNAQNGEVNIITNSEINLTADGNVSVQGKEVNILSDKLNVHEADEAMVRGDELQTQINKTNAVVQDIKDSLLKWAPVPQDGGANLKAYFLSLGPKDVGDFSNIKSEKSFLE